MLTKRYRLVISLYSITAHLMNMLNLYFLFTASHYTIDFTYGILVNKYLVYGAFPILEAVDIVFALLLVAITATVIIACGYMKKEDNTGIYLAIGCDIAIAFWSIFYPLAVLAITKIISPMLIFCICQLIVFIIISILTSVYFLKASYIL